VVWTKLAGCTASPQGEPQLTCRGPSYELPLSSDLCSRGRHARPLACGSGPVSVSRVSTCWPSLPHSVEA
jgi:hypothetical protein